MDSEKHSPRPSKKEAESTEANNDGIDAVPLSYKLPDDSTMRTNMQHSPRPSKEVKTEEVKTNLIKPIRAIPLSYRLPGDSTVISVRKNTKFGCQWRDNWIVQPRQRSNGKYDKYYYHKKTKLMCRSLVEVDNFELNGILPPHAQRGKNKTSSAAKESAQLVEKFYNDAYNNLHNRANPNMNESTEGNNEDRTVGESSKRREENSTVGLANLNNHSV